jgi:hypothetical protein
VSARIDSTGKVTPLGGRAEPTEVFKSADVEDPQTLADALTTLRDQVKVLERRFAVEFIDFEDIALLAYADVRLSHGFGGRVRWSVLDWISSVGALPPVLERNASATTSDVLVLTSSVAGTATIRVERAG